MGTWIQNVRIPGRDECVHVLIEDERIRSITPERPRGEQTAVDAEGNLALPGLINVHMHPDKAGLAEAISNRSGTITEARRRVLEAKPSLTREEVKQRAQKTILKGVQNGMTAARCHVDVDPSIGLRGMEAILELKEDLREMVDLQVVAFPQEGITESPGTYELMEEALRMGADIVGGHLSIARDFDEHAARVFELASRFDRDVDVHVDFDIDRDYGKLTRHEDGVLYPDQLGVVALAEATVRWGFQGRVSASHLCGLSAVPPESAANVVALLAKAGVAVVALPPCNLYIHGRADTHNVRRGVTPVRALQKAGVTVAFGTDNIRDPFNPLGNPNMIHNAILTAYACHMASAEDFERTIAMCTVIPAKIMKRPHYGLEPGNYADIVILEAPNIEEILANQSIATHVFKRGRLVATNRVERQMFI
jgi:cytosine/creatinine deaminase